MFVILYEAFLIGFFIGKLNYAPLITLALFAVNMLNNIEYLCGKMTRRYWNINLKEMIEARVHFGHGIKKWNPKMVLILQILLEQLVFYEKLLIYLWYGFYVFYILYSHILLGNIFL
ncbi:hypothetical protein ACJX0J_016045 [Zea mays]